MYIIFEMNKNKNSKEQLVIPPTSYKFYLGSRERYIHISSHFESGNIQLVRQMSEFQYRLSCLDDGLKTDHRVNSKSWFYFSVHGFPKSTKGKFTVSRVQTLMAVYSQYPKSYRPVYRQCFLSESKKQQWSGWSRIPTESPLILRESGQLECVFEFHFKNENHKVQFAFAYPYTYTKNIEYLKTLNEYYCNDQFYFHKEVLVKSPEKRDVHLLTITSHDQPNRDCEEEEIFNQLLFPQKCRPKRFKKPVVLITARVHPGETAASFAMQGIIDFLINNKDVRSYLLKKMFVFMIVPMINVDGVFHGNFRMDSYGKNLNRYYIDPSPDKQPAVYAIKQLANHLVKDSRLSFYFDLHAHNAKKGAFIYGNAINDFVEQVESQVFCKLFALNHSGFEYEYCNFSMKQMNSKDKNQERTKQGCGRVVMHRLANIIHSYSLQCGIISAIKTNIVPSAPNDQFQIGDKKLVDTKQSHIHGVGEPVFFTQKSYHHLGESLLVSILDVFDKNPYNRVYNSTHKSLELLRRVTAFQVFHTAERFRMFQKYVYGKVRNINQLIKEVLNQKLHYRELYNFYFFNDKELKNLQWPQNIPGLVKPKFHSKLKKFKSMNVQPRVDLALSFFNDLKANKYQLDNDLPLQNVNPQQIQQEQPIVDDQSYSSETQDEPEQQEFNDQYFKDIMMHSEGNIRQSQNQLVGEEQIPFNNEQRDQETINSFRGSQKREQTLWFSPQKSCMSEKISQKGSENMDYREQLYSNRFNQENQIKKLTALKIFQRVDQFQEKDLKAPNESPSVRVRRLLKQQNGIKRPKLSNGQMKQKLTEMISNPNRPLAHSGAFIGGNSSFGKTGQCLSNGLGIRAEKSQCLPHQDRQLRLFQEIKLQIKQQLRRHKERKGIISSTVKTQNKSIKSNIAQIKQKQKDRIRSTNLNFLNLNTQINLAHHKHKSQTLNRMTSKSNITKTQLPALNSHILIITSNSSKGIFCNEE